MPRLNHFAGSWSGFSHLLMVGLVWMGLVAHRDLSAAEAPAATPSAVSGYVEDFLDYRFDVQTKMENVWEGYMEKYGRQLKRGRATFSYHVNPDGKVTLVESPAKKVDPAILALAHRTIIEANQMPVPFPASVRQKFPSGYFNGIVFTVK
ncbi:MAG: hypothetical protein SFU85_09320 [Candidatus Methylacidiphilales bacterium]|nr:hypothetical protein [Candidatus Methylacidiphilales bacterium]